MTASARIPKSRLPAGGLPWRILLADDHAMVREALAQMLEGLDSHLSVAQAQDLPAALAILEKDHDFAVVLLDYNMPGMNGAASIVEIARLYPGLPVGIISGYLGTRELDPLIQAGAVGIFPKTMTGPALVMALKLALTGQTYVPWSGDLGQPDLRTAAEAAATPPADLSKRQIEVLQYLVKGAANKEIAHQLGLSEVTIKVHVAALCRKFGVANRTQLAMAALRVGIGKDNAQPG
jgi:DNA-binding NarL/FixJ family response regulator